MGYALIRIKPGAKCMQDHLFFTWPPSQYRDGPERIGVRDDCVFVAHKEIVGGKARWDCRAPGAGYLDRDQYGNGSIFVRGDVELLSPVLGFAPSEEQRRQAQEQCDE